MAAYGYYGTVLVVDLGTGKIERKSIPEEDLAKFLGGRGLGVKMLWDLLPGPGVDPLSGENPLIFTTGPLSCFPVPTASLCSIVTKSPHTRPAASSYGHASTVTYSNMGGFFGPELRFAGYEGIIIKGRSSTPVYLVIDDDRVEIRDATRFWGMNTDAFDRAFTGELGDRRFRTCYIGRAGENLVEYSSIISTAGRASGRGGSGCVMGSKKLKAIAVRGSKQPPLADPKAFAAILEKLRTAYTKPTSLASQAWNKLFHNYGSASAMTLSSLGGYQTVKNYSEGTFPYAASISEYVCRDNYWVKDFSCYCCPIACKKSGRIKTGSYAGFFHDGPEYETGTMLGANLWVSSLKGIIKEISVGDDAGIDLISTGNVIGFLMEAYGKKLIDKQFLDGIDLAWGNVNSILLLMDKIIRREGVGDMCSRGVKVLSGIIGRGSYKFAAHVKGQELAGWNPQTDSSMGISYATSNRGACHLNGGSAAKQNSKALLDSLSLCSFGQNMTGVTQLDYDILAAITGVSRSEDDLLKTGERVFNLEKMFNYREGFNRADDILPERFFTRPFTLGVQAGRTLGRSSFLEKMDAYYRERSWNTTTSRPENAKLEELGLSFTIG